MKFQELDISSQAEQRRNYWKEKVEQCPPDMMAREFIQNGLESPDAGDDKVISWEPFEYDGITKLSVVNNGVGMPKDELSRLADMAWSGDNKKQGRTGNKGIGARVAGLRNNKFGVVYISCYQGAVHKIRLCYNPEIGGYGAEMLAADSIAVNVTNDFSKADRQSDWVRVVFLGAGRESETIRRVGDKRRTAGWLPAEIFYRFFRIRGATVTVNEQLTTRYRDVGRTAHSKVKTCAEWFDGASYYDSVYSNGATIHYAYFRALDADDKRTTVGPALGVSSLGAIAWRGEFYDLSNGSDWRENAKHFGVPFISHASCVVVELPDDSPVFPSEYRDRIVWDGGDNDGREVRLRYFDEDVIEGRPSWLKDLIAERSKKFRRDQSRTDEEMLLRLWNELHMQTLKKVADSSGEETGDFLDARTLSIHEDHRNDRAAKKRKREVMSDSLGADRGSWKKSVQPLPRFIWCWEDADLEETNLKTPIAYYDGPGEVYVNMRHPIVSDVRRDARAYQMARSKGRISDEGFENGFRAVTEAFMRANIVAFVGGVDFNNRVDPNISRLQGLSDEALSALFALMRLPQNFEAIVSSTLLVRAA
jgi:hypothetical protein